MIEKNHADNVPEFSGSITALVTPMLADNRIDYPALERLVARQLEAGTQALVIAGTTGEAAALSARELGALLRHVVGVVAGQIPVLGGVGSPSTQHALEKLGIAEQAGVDGLLAVTPYYVRPTQAGLEKHFLTLTAATEKPLILYNVPARTGCDLLPETVLRLANCPQIVALKEATPGVDRIIELRALLPADFAVLSGDDPSAAAAMQAGAAGVVSVLSNLVPRAMRQLCELARSADARATQALTAELAPLHAGLALAPNPIAVKAALQELGLIDVGIRSPLMELSSPLRPKLKAALEHMSNLLDSSK